MLGQLKVYPHGFLVEPTHFGLVNCCGSSMMITTAAVRNDNNIAGGSFGYCIYNTAQFRPSFLTNLNVFRFFYGLEAIIFSEFYWLKATESMSKIRSTPTVYYFFDAEKCSRYWKALYVNYNVVRYFCVGKRPPPFTELKKFELQAPRVLMT